MYTTQKINQILAKCCKNRLRGYTPLGKILHQKLPILAISGMQAHIFKATTVKFGLRVQT